jgi:glycosyltransferase involved in cell wall biosynthesis
VRVLIYTRAFLPQIGGLELNVAHLAQQVVARGHEVVVITTTAANRPESLGYPVLRNPGPMEMLRWMRWCDVFHHPNVSLRGLWPLLVVRKPWVVSHHSWYRRPDGRVAWQDRLKRFVLRYAAGSIAISRAVAQDLATPSVVIGNAYRDRLFRRLPGVERSLDLTFVGRLVSDKGVDLLLDALALPELASARPTLTIVGEGPERPALEAQARRLGLDARVRFAGLCTGEDLVRLLNRHRILVIPSRYNEPFGIVALEGIACGCVAVGSEGGGLKDAIGPCGRTFPNRDAAALAGVLAELLGDPARLEEYRRAAPEHLARHAPARVMDAYVRVFEAAVYTRR